MNRACPSCNAEIPAASVFCPKCSAAITLAAAPVAVKGKRNNKVLMICCVAGVLLVAAIGGGIFLARSSKQKRAYGYAILLARDQQNIDAAISALEAALNQYPNNPNAVQARSLLFSLNEVKQEQLEIEGRIKRAKGHMHAEDYAGAASILEEAIEEFADSGNVSALKGLLIQVKQGQKGKNTEELAKALRKAEKMPMEERVEFLRSSLAEYPEAENLEQANEALERCTAELDRLEQERIAKANAKTFYLVLKAKNAPYGPFQFEEGGQIKMGNTVYTISINDDETFGLFHENTRKKLGPFQYQDEQELILSGYAFVLQRDDFEALQARQEEYQKEIAELIEKHREMEEQQAEQEAREKEEQEKLAQARAAEAAKKPSCTTCNGSGVVFDKFVGGSWVTVPNPEPGKRYKKNPCPQCTTAGRQRMTTVEGRSKNHLKGSLGGSPTSFGDSSGRKITRFGDNRNVQRMGE